MKRYWVCLAASGILSIAGCGDSAGGGAAPAARHVAQLRTPPKPADPIPADANKKLPERSLMPGEAVAFAEPVAEPPSGQIPPAGPPGRLGRNPGAFPPGGAAPPSAEQPADGAAPKPGGFGGVLQGLFGGGDQAASSPPGESPTPAPAPGGPRPKPGRRPRTGVPPGRPAPGGPAPSALPGNAGSPPAGSPSAPGAAPIVIPEIAPLPIGPAEAKQGPVVGELTEKAAPGVGVQGQGYGGGLITTPVHTFFAAKQMIVFNIEIPKAMQLFEATNNRKPRSAEEYMKEIIKAGNIALPELPAGDRYVYDPKTGDLLVEHPAKDSAK